LYQNILSGVNGESGLQDDHLGSVSPKVRCLNAYCCQLFQL